VSRAAAPAHRARVAAPAYAAAIQEPPSWISLNAPRLAIDERYAAAQRILPSRHFMMFPHGTVFRRHTAARRDSDFSFSGSLQFAPLTNRCQVSERAAYLRHSLRC